jgi:transcriptional regulator with XRE-family HTH domain
MQPDDRASANQKERARWDRVAAIILTSTRRDLELSQRELANRLGWTRNMVANLESGRRTLHLSDFLLIAEAFEMSPEALLQRILHWGNSPRPGPKHVS